mmetsp:Transcript_4917/g.10317  ORF Transcript_4917/g.10317 Transcript_4917/m.10317 type:complete len:231 (+) Transcript_4917:733-1425(+)
MAPEQGPARLAAQEPRAPDRAALGRRPQRHDRVVHEGLPGLRDGQGQGNPHVPLRRLRPYALRVRVGRARRRLQPLEGGGLLPLRGVVRPRHGRLRGDKEERRPRPRQRQGEAHRGGGREGGGRGDGEGRDDLQVRKDRERRGGQEHVREAHGGGRREARSRPRPRSRPQGGGGRGPEGARQDGPELRPSQPLPRPRRTGGGAGGAGHERLGRAGMGPRREPAEVLGGRR